MQRELPLTFSCSNAAFTFLHCQSDEPLAASLGSGNPLVALSAPLRASRARLSPLPRPRRFSPHQGPDAASALQGAEPGAVRSNNKITEKGLKLLDSATSLGALGNFKCLDLR